MTTKNKSKTPVKFGWQVIILLFAAVLLLLVIRLFILNPYNAKNIFSDVDSEFKKAGKKYNATVSQSNDLPVWWVSPDKLNIINDNSGGEVLKISDCENDPNQQNFKTAAQELGATLDKTLKRNGFIFNSQNSSKNIDDTQFYDYIQAYEKGNQKCVYTASPDCAGGIGDTIMAYSYSFACTDKYDENYLAQAPYLKDLGIKDAIVHISKRDGDFVLLNVNYRRSGYYTIAKLVSNKWVEVYSGQDLPPCKVINQNQVPKTIAPNCY